MGGSKRYGEDNGVLPFAVNRAAWKGLDYPKALFLLVRAVVLFAHQYRFMAADAARFKAIYDALSRDGHTFLMQNEIAIRNETRKMQKRIAKDPGGDHFMSQEQLEDKAATKIQGMYHIKKAREKVQQQQLRVLAAQKDVDRRKTDQQAARDLR